MGLKFRGTGWSCKPLRRGEDVHSCWKNPLHPIKVLKQSCWLWDLDTQGVKAEIRVSSLLANCLVKAVGEHLAEDWGGGGGGLQLSCCCFMLPESNHAPKANLYFKQGSCSQMAAHGPDPAPEAAVRPLWPYQICIKEQWTVLLILQLVSRS